MIERWEEKMVAAIDKCMARVRVRDAHEVMSNLLQ